MSVAGRKKQQKTTAERKPQAMLGTEQTYRRGCSC